MQASEFSSFTRGTARRRESIRVLLVEDFEAARQTILELLEDFGYPVTPAEDVQEALSVRGIPDVLVCDIGLPDGSGCELLRELRTRPGWEHVPAIAISAYDDEDDLLNAERAGFVRYMVKPVSIHEIDRAIRELVSG
jgi:CheY-like chemotaxis protein